MKKRKIKIISVCICILIMFTGVIGCEKENVQVDLKYSGENISNQEMFSLGQEESYNNFIGKGVCVVEKDKDVGSNESMNSSASLLFNITDETPIFAHDIYKRLYPASITKIFTALAVFESGKSLDEEVEFSQNAASITNEGAKLCGFKTGDKIKLSELLAAMLIYSGNDAGVAIAEHVAGSVEEFAKQMNLCAKRVGAIGTNMVNPHGLHDDNHYTTAYDIYLVFNKLLDNKTFCDIINVKSYTVNYKNSQGTSLSKTFASTNQYIVGKTSTPRGVTVLGGKTGFTDKAGKCLVIGSTDSKGKKYVSLVLNAGNQDSQLYSQMTNLLSMIE